jgi:Fe-S cluster biosynthesis and repair protein YggX
VFGDNGDSSTEISYFRCLILDECDGKCVVINVDNGEKVTVTKKRIKSVIAKNSASVLVKILPFMIINANLQSDSSVIESIKNSRYYKKLIKMTIIADHNDDRDDVEDSYQKFIQTSKDVTKKVDLFKLSSNNNNIDDKQQSVQLKSILKTTSVTITAPLKSSINYKVSHIESLKKFYLQSDQSLQIINSIENEIPVKNGQIKDAFVMNKKLYGVYLPINGRKVSRRVKLLQLQPNLTGDTLRECVYKVFFVDYGYTAKVNKSDIYELQDTLASFLPQAVCCYLDGFYPTEKECYADVDHHNETISSPSFVIKNQTDSNFVESLFNKLIKENHFITATTFSPSRDNERPLPKIGSDEPLPLQFENDQVEPLNVILHIFKDSKDFDDIRMKLSPSVYPKTWNDWQNEKNVSTILKNKLKQFNESLRSSLRPNLKEIHFENDEIDVEMGVVTNVNQFSLHLVNYRYQLAKIRETMQAAYNNVQIPPQRISKIEMNDIKIGMLCSCMGNSIFQRARIVNLNKLNNKTLAHLYLMDSGKYIDAPADQLYYLKDEHYDIEPLSFRCTFNIENNNNMDTMDMLTVKFKALVLEAKSREESFYVKIIKQIQNNKNEDPLEQTYFHVDLFTKSDRKSIRDTLEKMISIKTTVPSSIDSIEDAKIAANVSKNILPSVYQKILSQNKEKSIQLESVFQFEAINLKLNEPLRVRLVGCDTSQFFGVILLENLEKREEFIRSISQWHKERRSSLKPLSNDDDLVGKPCVIQSVQVNRWCRGFVLSMDQPTSKIYLIDHCKTVQVDKSRIFAITERDHLTAPCYVNRCQLISGDHVQTLGFNKFIDSIKNNGQKSRPIKSNPVFDVTSPINDSNDDSMENEQDDNLQIDIGDQKMNADFCVETLELTIECVECEITKITPATICESKQYKIKVTDFQQITQKANRFDSPIVSTRLQKRSSN